jgi:hypothetical protein
LEDVQCTAAATHLPENTGDQAFDVVVVELKEQAAAKSTKSTTR